MPECPTAAAAPAHLVLVSSRRCPPRHCPGPAGRRHRAPAQAPAGRRHHAHRPGARRPPPPRPPPRHILKLLRTGGASAATARVRAPPPRAPIGRNARREGRRRAGRAGCLPAWSTASEEPRCIAESRIVRVVRVKPEPELSGTRNVGFRLFLANFGL